MSAKKKPKYNLPNCSYVRYGWGIDAAYDTENNCEEYGCTYQCYCTKISNVKLSFNGPEELFARIAGYSKIKSVKDYTLDRTIRQLITVDSFKYDIITGYYGEELEIEILASKANELGRFIDMLNTGTDAEAIEEALTYEYGHVLPELKNKKWSVKSVDVNKITFGDQYRRVYRPAVKEYLEKDNLACLCIERKDGSFRLIDGYHRLSAAKEKECKKITVICCHGK